MDVENPDEAPRGRLSGTRSIQADLAIVGAEMHPFLESSTLGRTTERVVRFFASVRSWQFSKEPTIPSQQEMNPVFDKFFG